MLEKIDKLVVSIVSHGHIYQVQNLLEQLAKTSGSSVTRVVVTHNIPEHAVREPSGGWPFELQIRCNSKPYGFGLNHNIALQGSTEPFVCVLNPDVILISGQDPFAVMLHAASEHNVGCVYPQQIDERGKLQDSERALPTPSALWRRWILGCSEDRVDWVNAACMVIPLKSWQVVGGFDERYFMYCEDVDLCLRLRLKGLTLVKVSVSIIHAGKRDSHRRFRNFFWHVSSLLRLWSSDVYRRMRVLSDL